MKNKFKSSYIIIAQLLILGFLSLSLAVKHAPVFSSRNSAATSIEKESDESESESNADETDGENTDEDYIKREYVDYETLWNI